MFNAILAYPLVTHFLLASLYLAVVGLPAAYLFGIWGLVVSAICVSVFFYGREAGQREHDLKNLGVNPWLAWLGSEFAFKWSRSNVLEWASPTIAVALGVLIYWTSWAFGFLSFS